MQLEEDAAAEAGFVRVACGHPDLADALAALAVEDAFVARALDEASVLVLPSRSEGLGRVVVEAFCRGRGIVASRVGGIPDIDEDGATGILVPPSDSESLGRRILEVLRDPLRARAIGENAREMVQREFPISRMIDETVALYERVLTSYPAAA